MRSRLLALTVVAGFLLAAGARGDEAPANDYPTADRADFVIGCMAANGNTRESLMKCSCAIDAIAGLMPYKQYEMAATALSMQQVGGERMAMFRDTPQVKAVLEKLHQAEAEANLQCFE